MFERQKYFMEMLEMHDKIVPWPIDLKTKQGQRLAKELIMNITEELFEASFTLKNKQHRLTDDRDFDRDHYVEELGDAFAFFMELCIMSDISSDDLYKEYCRKNAIVQERLRDGY